MEAGAQLQTEASRLGHEREATVNIHMPGAIKQKTEVEMAAVQKAQVHTTQETQGVECRLVNNKEEVGRKEEFHSYEAKAF